MAHRFQQPGVRRWRWRVFRRIPVVLMTVGLIVGLAIAPRSMRLPFPNGGALSFPVGVIAPASAQRAEVEAAAAQVYAAIPDFPLENQYVNRESGEVAETNTLVSRLVRYHIYVTGRPPFYRLDWKLTLADYLGVNERMVESTYPSADTLRTNPIAGDRAAIQSLTRAQRQTLVQVLTDFFNPTPTEAPMAPTDEPSESLPEPTPSPSSPGQPQSLPDPQPGDAELLL